MGLPFFPSVDDLMQLILAELPQGTYAIDFANDPDPDMRSVSSSELRAHATLIAALYSNLNGIWSDKFLTSVTPGGIDAWEKQLFATAQDTSISFAARQARIIAKFRSNGGISYTAIRAIVATILDPLSIDFELASWSGPHDGAWIMDESELDIGTYLSVIDPILGARRDLPAIDCSLDPTLAGLTHQDLLDIQAAAYTYELRIFGHADNVTLATLEAILKHLEPARSTHLILNDHVAPELTGPQ